MYDRDAPQVGVLADRLAVRRHDAQVAAGVVGQDYATGGAGAVSVLFRVEAAQEPFSSLRLGEPALPGGRHPIKLPLSQSDCCPCIVAPPGRTNRFIPGRAIG